MGDLQGLRGKPVRADSGVARSVDRGPVPRRGAVAFRVKASASTTGLAAVALDEARVRRPRAARRLLTRRNAAVSGSTHLGARVRPRRHVELDHRGARSRPKRELSPGGLRRTRDGSIRRGGGCAVAGFETEPCPGRRRPLSSGSETILRTRAPGHDCSNLAFREPSTTGARTATQASKLTMARSRGSRGPRRVVI